MVPQVSLFSCSTYASPPFNWQGHCVSHADEDQCWRGFGGGRKKVEKSFTQVLTLSKKHERIVTHGRLVPPAVQTGESGGREA